MGGRVPEECGLSRTGLEREHTPHFTRPALPALLEMSRLNVYLSRVNNSHNHVQQLPAPQGLIWKLERKRRAGMWAGPMAFI